MQSLFIGAYKLARHVLEKIQGLVVPKRFKENVDLATLMIRAKPYYDNEELLVCFIYNQGASLGIEKIGLEF